MQPLYLPADQIKRGDILPDKSRSVVTSVVVFPRESVRVTHGGGQYTWHAPYGGPDFGYAVVRIERP